MKFQACESELEKLRSKPNVLEESSRLESQLKSGRESRNSVGGGENKAEVIKRLHELDIKGQELARLVARSKEECLEKIQTEIDLLNEQTLDSLETPLDSLIERQDHIAKKI
jgi:hypothetical protein